MDSNKVEYHREETPPDGLQLVRDINRYLKKALKKIEAIQRASDPSLQEKSIFVAQDGQEVLSQDHNEICSPVKSKRPADQQCLEISTIQPVNKPSNGKKKITSSKIPIDNLNSSLSEPTVEDAILENEHCRDNIETEDTSQNDVDSHEDEPSYSQDSVALTERYSEPCINFKIDESTVFYPLPLFYKAFLSNLPLTVNVSKLKAWLESKCVSSYEDITVYTKQTFKTSIVSYYDKVARDRLLLLNGEILDNTPVKIRCFIDQFSADVTKNDSKKKTQK